MFIREIKEFMADVKPAKVDHKSKSKMFVYKEMDRCSHVFLQTNPNRPPLHRPYSGLHKIIDRAQDGKTVTIDINGKAKVVSIERVKPAHYLASELEPEEMENESDDGDRASRVSSEGGEEPGQLGSDLSESDNWNVVIDDEVPYRDTTYPEPPENRADLADSDEVLAANAQETQPTSSDDQRQPVNGGNGDREFAHRSDYNTSQRGSNAENAWGNVYVIPQHRSQRAPRVKHRPNILRKTPRVECIGKIAADWRTRVSNEASCFNDFRFANHRTCRCSRFPNSLAN